MRTWRRSLAGRITLVCALVATVAVLITGVTVAQLVRGTLLSQARETLQRQADALAKAELATTEPATSGPATTGSVTTGLPATEPATTGAATTEAAPDRLPLIERVLGLSDVRVVYIDASGATTGPAAALLDPATSQTLLSGTDVSETVRIGGQLVLIEGRALAQGGAVVVGEPVAAVDAAAAVLRRRVLLGLTLGLVGALVAGTLLARRLAGPLTRTATVARRLAQGERGVGAVDGLPPGRPGPAGATEVADVASALASLDTALQVSEGRQREFLLSVSHEIRTPLTAVRGYAEALADGVVTGAQVAEVGRTLRAEAERLDRFLADLLELARLESDDFRVALDTVDLDALAASAVAAWSARVGQLGVELRLESAGVPVIVATDPMRLRQVVDGLVENSLRVTPAGRAVVIAVRRADGHTDDQGQAIIEVRDGGPGLTPDDVRVAFDRGALRSRYEAVRPVGTGLGLSIVDRLVTRLGGSIEAAGDAAEGGARFTVTLPHQS